MPPIENLVFGLRLTACGLGILAIARLCRAGIYKRFRVLLTFLCFTVVRSLALFGSAWFPRPRNTYAWIWVATEPLLWIFYILLALDLYSLILQNYKGLQTVGRWIFLIALPFSILVSGLTVLPYWSNPRGPVIFFYYTTIDRGIMFSMVIFILITLMLLSWFPISLNRNTVIHAIVCTIFLISASLGYFLRNVQGDTVSFYHEVDLAHQVITVLCWSAWLFLLTPKGEQTEVVVHHKSSPEEEARLLNQLTAMNASLLETARK